MLGTVGLEKIMAYYPTFGQVVRASRLGYKYAPKYGAFLRVSVLDEKRIRLDIHPIGLIDGLDKVNEYVMWWEGIDVLTQCPALQGIRDPKARQTIIVDNNGEKCE
jgi:hypothetical protein